MATNDSQDFFARLAYTPDEDSEVPAGVPRDRWKRPMIRPPGGEELVAYTRASTMASYIADFSGLHTWKMRNLARGMGVCTDLAPMAGALDEPNGDRRHDAQINEALDEIIELAAEAAGEHAKAHWGTAIHGYTDPFARTGPVPDQMQADVRSYEDQMRATGLVVFATEVFVVNHELKVAGTVDELLGVPALGEAMVGDKKTGKKNMHSTLVQLAAYSTAEPYDAEQQRSMPMEEYLQAVCAQAPPFNSDRAIYTHIPAGEGKTAFHPMDLQAGKKMLKICATVRDFRRDKSFLRDDISGWLTQNRDTAVVALIASASTPGELEAITELFAWMWTDSLDQVRTARSEALGRS